MRAFVAIELDADVRAHVAACQRRLRERVDSAQSRSRVSWTPPDTAHLTIKFLGDINEAAGAALRQTLAPALRAIQPFTIPLTRIGAFASPRDPRVLWVGPPDAWTATDDSRRLQALHRAVDDACAGIGVARDDRPFAPHLTIARVRDGGREVGRVLTQAQAFDVPCTGPPLSVQEVVLFKSVLGAHGAAHTPLWSAKFWT